MFQKEEKTPNHKQGLGFEINRLRTNIADQIRNKSVLAFLKSDNRQEQVHQVSVMFTQAISTS
jgi:hypothetical protein